jgi:hypothetical protein
LQAVVELAIVTSERRQFIPAPNNALLPATVQFVIVTVHNSQEMPPPPWSALLFSIMQLVMFASLQ